MKKIYQAPCVQVYRISVKSLVSISMPKYGDEYVDNDDDFGWAREDANEEDESQTKNRNVWDNEW